MKYYMDCEFDGLNGALLSMGIVSETGRSLYAVMNRTASDPWVLENIVPLLYSVPQERIQFLHTCASSHDLSFMLQNYFSGYQSPHVVADWPDDIKYLCEALITGPGTMINVPGMTFEVKRVDAYPTSIKEAVQHNAWWDAIVLWKHIVIADNISEAGL